MGALMPAAAQAAESLTMINGAFARPVTMDELNLLVDEGVSDGGLHLVLSETNTEPADARAFLTQTINYDVASADALFRSAEGMAMISELSEIIMPRSTGKDSESALRAAVIKSLMDDNTLTPLEIVANYPVDAQIDVVELRNRQGNMSYAGIDKLATMMQSVEAKSSTQLAHEELEVRFAQTDVRMQDRYYAMWSSRSEGARPVALESSTFEVEPINGLW